MRNYKKHRPNYKYLTPEERSELIDRWVKGESTTSLSIEFQIATSTVSDVVQKHFGFRIGNRYSFCNYREQFKAKQYQDVNFDTPELPFHFFNSAFHMDTILNIMRLWKQYYSYSDIAKKVYCHRETVRKIVDTVIKIYDTKMQIKTENLTALDELDNLFFKSIK